MSDQNQTDHHGAQHKRTKGCEALSKAQFGIIELGQTVSGTQMEVDTPAKGQDQTNGAVINLWRKHDGTANEHTGATDEVCG